jgi:hypothetical protein
MPKMRKMKKEEETQKETPYHESTKTGKHEKGQGGV